MEKTELEVDFRAMKKALTTPIDPLETLHIAVGHSCNNNCIFCMESDRENRYTRLSRLDDETISSILEEKKGLGKVVFTSGEPTLNTNLNRYISLARGLGYGSVSLVTNGRMLCYPDFADGLLAGGLTEIIISIHSSQARLHERLTRSPGSFTQSLAGLKNLSSLKKKYRFDLHVSRIVCRANIRGLAEDCLFFSQFPIDSVIINPLMPQGRADNRRLLARYSDIVAGISGYITGRRARISLNDVPLCAAVPILANLGTMERYHIRDDDDGAYSSPVLQGRTRRERCGSCAFDRVCIGVWEKYIEYFGWDEFEPVERSAAGKLLPRREP